MLACHPVCVCACDFNFRLNHLPVRLKKQQQQQKHKTNLPQSKHSKSPIVAAPLSSATRGLVCSADVASVAARQIYARVRMISSGEICTTSAARTWCTSSSRLPDCVGFRFRRVSAHTLLPGGLEPSRRTSPGVLLAASCGAAETHSWKSASRQPLRGEQTVWYVIKQSENALTWCLFVHGLWTTFSSSNSPKYPMKIETIVKPYEKKMQQNKKHNESKYLLSPPCGQCVGFTTCRLSPSSKIPT